ncbi:MAG: hypothetical protein IPJ07_23515 [Acidobacteria bacterium]|nr:hypothetical protein [Acidobacteriota bacterium]
MQLFAQRAQFVGQGFIFNASQILQSSFFGLSSINADTLFTQKTIGGTVSLSGPLQVFTKRFRKFSQFARPGLSYSLTANSIEGPR